MTGKPKKAGGTKRTGRKLSQKAMGAIRPLEHAGSAPMGMKATSVGQQIRSTGEKLGSNR